MAAPAAAAAAPSTIANDEPVPIMQPTSLAIQAYGTFSPYRIQAASDSHSGTQISASSAILLAWSQKLQSRAASDADRNNAELLASIARGIAADPYGDSWIPLMRHFSTAGSEIPSTDLAAICSELGVTQEQRSPTNDNELDEDYADEDALIASITAEEFATQVRGEEFLTDEQRKNLLGL